MGLQNRVTAEEMDHVSAWEKAKDLFERGLFEDAEKIFSALVKENPHDGTAKLYADRCVKYLQSPPPEGWDGVNNLTEK